MNPATEAPSPVPPPVWSRAAAIPEVLLAFAIVHVSYRAFKHFTPLGRMEADSGLNYSAGATMILFTVGVLLLGGRRFADYGLTLAHWRSDLTMGLFWIGALILVVGIVVGLSAIRIDPMNAPDLTKAIASSAGHVAAIVILLLSFRRLDLWLKHIGLSISALLFAMVFMLPLVVAVYAGRPFCPVLLQVLWLFFGAGFGEEIFFRGYIQSRVDQSFGRPWRFLGLEFGPGLMLSSLLFGLIHSLNHVDYFGGALEFSWLWGASNFFTGLFFGCLREKAKSVLPGAILHGLGDVLATVPALLP